MQESNNQFKEEEEKLPSESEHQLKVLTAKISPVKAAWLGLAGGFFFYQFIGGFLTILIFGLNPKNADVNAFRLMTVAGQILFILLPALIFSKIIYEDVTEIIRFRTTSLKEIGLFTAGIIALTPLLQNMLFIQNYFIELLAKNNSTINYIKSAFDSLNKTVEATYGDLLKINSVYDAMIVIIAVSIIPAVCEETMFRGFIQRSFELKYKPFLAAFITSIFFGVYHFNPYAIIGLIALGLYFGYAAYKSNSILVPVVLHFINNFSAVILYMIFGDEELIQNKAIPQSELTSSLINFGYQLIIFIGIIVIITRYYKKKPSIIEVKAELPVK